MTPVPNRPAVGVLAAVVAVLLLAAGCAPTGAGRGAGGGPTGASRSGPGSGPSSVPVSSEPPSTPSARDLASLKKVAGIPDCPTSDPKVKPHMYGLPDIELECLGGGRKVRLAGLRGKPMIVNIWAQWCPPCRAEAPFLSEVAAQANGKVVFLGIDYDDPEPDWAIEFARLSGWKYPQMVDRPKVLRIPLQLAAGAPQTLFITAAGEITTRHAGPFESADEIREITKEYLGVTL